MAYRGLRVIILALISACWLSAASQQNNAFVVGKETATSDLIRPFQPTRMELPQEFLDVAGRKQLMRDLSFELGFAMRAIPVGPPGIVLHANGRIEPGNAELQTRLYKRGISIGQGERFQVTNLEIGVDRIVFDLNGGPYLKHRFLRHLEINGASIGQDPYERVTGSRVILLFEQPVPKLTAAEVKLLLEPVLNFGEKRGPAAYAETLPDFLRTAVEQHDVLVGMTRQMVTASLGQPVMKVREHPDGGPDGEVLEEWIYGKTPQTMRFVRFRGDRVVLLKIAALGKPIEIHDKDEMASFRPPAPERIIPLGDKAHTDGSGDSPEPAKAPSLLGDGERSPDGRGKVQIPVSHKDGPRTVPDGSSPEKASNDVN